MYGLFKGIHFGADYNPDQWPSAVVEDDIAMMKEAGVTIVTPAVFSWARLEPEEGTFDFGWLDEVMDRLAAAGIAVDLATATASPPPWLGRNHPDTLPVTADGTPLRWGSRQQYNPSSATFRAACARLVTAMAERYGSHPALSMWHVGNEYGCHVTESFDEESAAAFRTWLELRYGTLEELNRVWSTSFWSQHYSAWREVMPPGPTPSFANPAHRLDWRRFSSDAVLACFENEVRILREITPAVPITTNFLGLLPGLDYWKWAKLVDVVSNDSYPDPSDPRAARHLTLEADLARSLGDGRPFIQMEQAPGAVQWRARNAPKRPGQFALWSLDLVAHGADAVCQFQWRQSAGGAEMFHSGMVPHAGRESTVWTDVVETGRLLAQLGDVSGSEVHARTAIVWDWENAWALESAIGPVQWDAFETVAGWHATLFERGYTVDFVRVDADLTGYDLVVVPSLFLGADRAAAPLTEAVRNGSTVLVTHGSGYLRDDGRAYLGGYLGPLAKLLGVRVLDLIPRGEGPVGGEPVGASARICGAVTARTDCTVRWLDPRPAEGRPLRSDRWAERIAVDSAEVLASFRGVDVDGLPAITRRRVGTGEAWYLAAELDEDGRDDLIAELERRGGLAPEALIPPAGVEAVRRGRHLFLLNHSDEPKVVSGVIGTDVLTGAGITGAVEVGPRTGVVLRQASEDAMKQERTEISDGVPSLAGN